VDNQGMVADSEKGMQKLMDGLVRVAEQYDTKVNVKKTKVTRVSKKKVKKTLKYSLADSKSNS
jgi:hypothetical protein